MSMILLTIIFALIMFYTAISGIVTQLALSIVMIIGSVVCMIWSGLLYFAVRAADETKKEVNGGEI